MRAPRSWATAANAREDAREMPALASVLRIRTGR